MRPRCCSVTMTRYRSPIQVDHLTVADLVFHPAEGMDAEGVAADAPLRLLGQLNLGDQVAGCRIPPGELDAGCFPDQTASAVAPDEILRPQRLAVGQRDVDTCVFLREARHLTAAWIGTANSPTQPARMRSMWFCHNPSP